MLVKTSIMNRFTKIRHIKLVKNLMRYLYTKIRQIQLDKTSIKNRFPKIRHIKSVKSLITKGFTKIKHM